MNEKEIEDKAEALTREVLQMYINWSQSIFANYSECNREIIRSALAASVISICCGVSKSINLSKSELNEIIDEYWQKMELEKT